MSAPDWVHEAVFYQVFPDRFANGDPALDPQQVRGAPVQGGDLRGAADSADLR